MASRSKREGDNPVTLVWMVAVHDMSGRRGHVRHLLRETTYETACMMPRNSQDLVVSVPGDVKEHMHWLPYCKNCLRVLEFDPGAVLWAWWR